MRLDPNGDIPIQIQRLLNRGLFFEDNYEGGVEGARRDLGIEDGAVTQITQLFDDTQLQQSIQDIQELLESIDALLELLFSADSLLMNYALFTSSRAEAQPGRFFDPVITDSAGAGLLNVFRNPSITTVKFPTWNVGVAGNTAAQKRILFRDEKSGLFTLSHATKPSSYRGFGPLLAIFDFWLAPARPDLWEASPSTWFGLCEERITDTTVLPSSSTYGALLALTAGPSENWKAIFRSDSLGVFSTSDLGIDAISEDFHRWTFVIENKALDVGGRARLFHDGVQVLDVPTEEVPAAAMFIAGAVGAPTDANSFEKGFRLGHMQAYHTRATGFLPFGG